MEYLKKHYSSYYITNTELNTSDTYLISNDQLEVIINNHPTLIISGENYMDDYLPFLKYSEKLELLSVGVYLLNDSFFEKFREGETIEDDFDFYDEKDLPDYMKKDLPEWTKIVLPEWMK